MSPALPLALTFALSLGSGVLAIDPAQEELAAFPEGAAALAAHRGGLADVAVRRLETLIATAELSPVARGWADQLRVENLVRGARYQDALDLLNAFEQAAGVEPRPHVARAVELPYWRGVALAGLGQTDEAAALLTDYALDAEHPHRTSATLTLASAFAAAREPDRALKLLHSILESDPDADAPIGFATAELQLSIGAYAAAANTIENLSGLAPQDVDAGRLLHAEALLRGGAPEAAAGVLETLLSNRATPLPHLLHSRATLLMSEALIATGKTTAARAALLALAENTRDPATLLVDLDRLDEIGALATSEGRRQLEAWSAGTNELLANAARFFLAKHAVSQSRPSDALALLTPLANGSSAIALRSKLLLIRVYLDQDATKAAAEIAKLKAGANDAATLAQIEFVQARTRYEAGDFEAAADGFAAAADDSAPADEATFNAALAALKAGDDKEFKARLALLPELSGEALRADLMLERALLLAAQSDKALAELETAADRAKASEALAESRARAAEALAEFLGDHPKHPRIAEVHLAQASLHLLEYPARSNSAREALAAARLLDLDDVTRERADYIAFWIEEEPGDSAKAVELAETFLKNWPRSPLAPEVRMRQAEIHFRNGDYLDARLKFEELHSTYPESPLADKALFYAGRAAMLTNTKEGATKALELWQKLASGDSPLALPARRNQAQVLLRQGEPTKAISLLDDILGNTPPPPLEMRVSCLLVKGEALLLLGSKDPAAFVGAIDAFGAVRDTEGVGTAALNQALFLKGKAHESLGDPTGALLCFSSVVNSPRPPLEPGEVPEFRWYYRAGFECIRLLQAKGTDGDIDAAIGIADALTRTGGPRAEEARKAAQQLRLEHFRWR